MSPITSPSELNKRITIQAPTRVADGMGGFTVTWENAATVWAAIWPVSAAETIRSGQIVMTTTHRVRIRYRTYIPRSGWRILYGTKYFDIASVIEPDMGHQWIDMLCREVA